MRQAETAGGTSNASFKILQGEFDRVVLEGIYFFGKRKPGD